MCIVQVAAVHRKPGCPGEGEQTRNVVLHSVLIDKGERDHRRAAPCQSPRSVAANASSDSQATTVSTLPALSAVADASTSSPPASSTRPASRRASPSSHSASARHELHAASRETASVASAIIWSAPLAHMAARNIARADAKEADPSAGARSNEAASTNEAHRSAPLVSPVSTASSTSERREAGIARCLHRRCAIPALSGRQLACVVCGLGQGCR